MSIYNEITEERRRQDEKWGGPEHDDGHSLEMWVFFITKHAMRGILEWNTHESGARAFRRQMIRVAALAVAAAEVVDRALVRAKRIRDNEFLDRLEKKYVDEPR